MSDAETDDMQSPVCILLACFLVSVPVQLEQHKHIARNLFDVFEIPSAVSSFAVKEACSHLVIHRFKCFSGLLKCLNEMFKG
jgi:hypothetical protein